MILANVAAAEELEGRHAPCVWRVHAPPSAEKLEALARVSSTGSACRCRRAIRCVRATSIACCAPFPAPTEAPLVNEVMLRSQSQAAYAAANIGHFGLALPRYAHFTSPIRRYADLVVHRSLIRALRLGTGGLAAPEAAALEETAEHISRTERRSALAERDATDRYLAAFLAERVGASFAARISGVTRFGLFVTLDENGASGIVPRTSLPDDLWWHDERAQTLSGRRTGLVFHLAEPVEVRFAEANAITGGLVFHLMQGVPAAPPAGRRNRVGALAKRRKTGECLRT